MFISVLLSKIVSKVLLLFQECLENDLIGLTLDLFSILFGGAPNNTEKCDKKHMVWRCLKSHTCYSSRVHEKSVQWYPLRVFFFFRMPLCFGISVAKHMELKLESLNRYIKLS